MNRTLSSLYPFSDLLPSQTPFPLLPILPSQPPPLTYPSGKSHLLSFLLSSFLSFLCCHSLFSCFLLNFLMGHFLSLPPISVYQFPFSHIFPACLSMKGLPPITHHRLPSEENISLSSLLFYHSSCPFFLSFYHPWFNEGVTAHHPGQKHPSLPPSLRPLSSVTCFPARWRVGNISRLVRQKFWKAGKKKTRRCCFYVCLSNESVQHILAQEDGGVVFMFVQ